MTEGANIRPNVRDLALGLSIYLRIPPEVRLGSSRPTFEEAPIFDVEAPDITTGQIWSAKGSYDIETTNGSLVLQHWDAQATDRFADDDLIYQMSIALGDFLLQHHRVERKIYLQELEWENSSGPISKPIETVHSTSNSPASCSIIVPASCSTSMIVTARL